MPDEPISSGNPAPAVVETPPAAAPESSGAAPKTYTPPVSQEELDKIIDRRITQERRKYADYDVLKEKAKSFDEFQESQKTETERLRGAALKANQDRDAALARAEDTLIRAAIVSEA